jgi:DNA-binding MarR family transcriptional regulator/N-acetylglutamate synthase-like GNAT family acetyltransferase
MLQINQGDSKVTPGHWHALIEVSKQPEITISQLGHLLLITTSTASRIVKALAKDGLLRLTDGKDKREKHLHLTEAGVTEIKKIDAFSEAKIKGAFELLTDQEITQIIQAIATYGKALEESRSIREGIKIKTLSTSRVIRKQIVTMIENIQRNEFSIPITSKINLCVLKAEKDFYCNNSYNFWYAIDTNGGIIGSIGLKKVNVHCGEIKKLFVVKEYRNKGVAQKLMGVLLKAASRHKFDVLVLGTVDKLQAAQKFYIKCGFTRIGQKDLPSEFEICPLDTVFFKAKVKNLNSPQV